MRYMRKWAWENIWTVWSVVALIVVPWLLAFITVPHLGAVYRESGASVILLSALFGFLWGIAGFLFGLSIQLVGMSLTFAVVNGLSSAIGSWVPLLVQHPGEILSAGGLIVSAGVIGVVGGVATCSWAGHLRSKQPGTPATAQDPGVKSPRFWRRLMVTVTTGVVGPCLNLGFAFGQKISTAAVNAGSSLASSTNAVLAVVLSAGFLSNLAYCLYRLVKNRTAPLFAIPESGKYFLLGLIMGTLWIVSYSLYGSSISYFGTYGAVVGWPMLMGVMTVVSGLWDVAYGEWTKRPLQFMAWGVIMVIAAVGIISYGMFRLQHGA
jgi:L-rhamnose-H+ transport protein